jgi:uncharacterized caspase-like protein
LQMIDLVQIINRELKARQVVLILDTCYSGDALSPFSGGNGTGDAVPKFSQAFDNLKFGYGRAVLTAGRANEQSWESKQLEHGGNGYFMHYLLEVLREGHAGESIGDEFARVQARVSARVKADLNVNQNPSFEFSEQAGTIVIGTPEAEEN